MPKWIITILYQTNYGLSNAIRKGDIYRKDLSLLKPDHYMTYLMWSGNNHRQTRWFEVPSLMTDLSEPQLSDFHIKRACKIGMGRQNCKLWCTRKCGCKWLVIIYFTWAVCRIWCPWNCDRNKKCKCESKLILFVVF